MTFSEINFLHSDKVRSFIFEVLKTTTFVNDIRRYNNRMGSSYHSYFNNHTLKRIPIVPLYIDNSELFIIFDRDNPQNLSVGYYDREGELNYIFNFPCGLLDNVETFFENFRNYVNQTAETYTKNNVKFYIKMCRESREKRRNEREKRYQKYLRLKQEV